MLTSSDEDILREIAFTEGKKEGDRVAACKTLFGQGKYLEEIRATLESISTNEITADSIRIKAIDLLEKVREDLLQVQASVSASDEALIRKTLMSQYVGKNEITGSP